MVHIVSPHNNKVNRVAKRMDCGSAWSDGLGDTLSTRAKKHGTYMLSSKNSDKLSYSAVHEKANQQPNLY